METNLQQSISEYNAALSKSLLDITIESWRFARLFSRMMRKLDAGESARYMNQYRFYLKHLEENLQAVGITLVNMEEMPYDPGIAANALNLQDFEPNDALVIDQMLEPIVMGPNGLLREGTIMLRRV